MLDILLKFSIGGGIGFLLGLLLVWWVEPTTPEGSTLLIIVCVILGIVVNSLFQRKSNDS